MDDFIHQASSLRDYPSVRDFLYALRYHGAKYGLDRMRDFAEHLQLPYSTYPCIHVAGTNGKGSTCAMLEVLFRRYGLRTGLYTSPHLIRQGERIQVDRVEISENEIADLCCEINQKLIRSGNWHKDNWPSFFEFMTGMAFEYFRTKEIDVGIIETGLGGRLDATNVLTPKVSVITSIGLDHTHILGDTLSKIAFEKAGIIKSGIPTVIGNLPAEAEAVIRQKCRDMDSELFTIRDRWGEEMDNYPETNLVGSFQKINAATAVLAAEVSEIVSEGDLNLEALKQVDWPGRWEELKINGGRNTMILDSTHNEEGAKMLRENLESNLSNESVPPVAVIGSLGLDRAESLVSEITPFVSKIFLVQPAQPRAVSTHELKRLIPNGFEGDVVETSVGELFCYRGSHLPLLNGQKVIVSGSIYLIGEVSDLVKCETSSSQQGLQDVI